MRKILIKLLCVASILALAGMVLLRPDARREYPFEFLLKTVCQPDGDYLKLILPMRNFPRIKMGTLITPRQEKINLKRNDFKINRQKSIMISNKIKVNEITAGLYRLEVAFQNNSTWAGTLHFIPDYIPFPKNITITDSAVTWDFDDKVGVFKVEVMDTNGHVVWESKHGIGDFFLNALYSSNLNHFIPESGDRLSFKSFIDGSKLQEGNEYGLRIKSYGKEAFPMPWREQIDFANENISETKKFFYHKSAPRLLSWQISNIAFNADMQTGIYMMRVRMTNPWAIKKIICIDPQGMSYRLKKAQLSYIGYLPEQEDGIFTLKIYSSVQEPLIVRKQFLFSKEHSFPSNINYTNGKISWDKKEGVDLYQVRIYREDKSGLLSLTKLFNSIFDGSLQLEESGLAPNTHYGYVILAFKSIRNGESVNVSISPLYYFRY